MYATAILATSVVSLTSALYQTRTNQANLRDTIVTSEVVTRLRAGGAAEEVQHLLHLHPLLLLRCCPRSWCLGTCWPCRTTAASFSATPCSSRAQSS